MDVWIDRKKDRWIDGRRRAGGRPGVGGRTDRWTDGRMKRQTHMLGFCWVGLDKCEDKMKYSKTKHKR